MHTLLFSPGDTVYFLKDLTIQKGTVEKVFFNSTKTTKDEKYVVQTPSKLYQKHYDEDEWYELLTLEAFELFSTKEGLIARIAEQG